jgi:hypothetical protein
MSRIIDKNVYHSSIKQSKDLFKTRMDDGDEFKIKDASFGFPALTLLSYLYRNIRFGNDGIKDKILDDPKTFLPGYF